MSVKQQEAAGIMSSSNSIKEARISPIFGDLKLEPEGTTAELSRSGFPVGLSYASARVTAWNVASSTFIMPVFSLGPASGGSYAIDETVTVSFTYYGGLLPNPSWAGGHLVPDSSHRQYFGISSDDTVGSGSGTTSAGWTNTDFIDDTTYLLFNLSTDIEYGVNDSITISVIRGRGIQGAVGTVTRVKSEQRNAIVGANRAFGPVM